MQRLPVKRLFCATALFCVLLAAVVLTASGCASSAQAEADRLEALYGPTVSEVNSLRVSGVISAETYHDVVTPARKSAREGLDRAKALIAAGQTDQASVILQGVDASLLELLKFLTAPPATAAPELKPPASQPTSRPAPEPLQASTAGAGLLLALTLLQNWGKVQPVITKLVKGEELTPEERALAELHSAQADAEADQLDAEAVDELKRGS